MASKIVYLSGKAKWCRLKKPDKFGNWSIQLYPDTESLARFQTLNLKNEVNEDDDGKFIYLRRPVSKLMKGRVVEFTAPEVLDADGQPTDVNIGNGSDVTVKLTVYSGSSPRGSYVGSRMEAIRIDKLVEFVPQENKDIADRQEPENLPF